MACLRYTDTDAEKLKLIAKPSKNASFVEWRSWAIVNWILATGHRAGTVVEIKLGDINYSRDEIMVRKTKTNKAWSSKNRMLDTVIDQFGKDVWLSKVDDQHFKVTVPVL